MLVLKGILICIDLKQKQKQLHFLIILIRHKVRSAE